MVAIAVHEVLLDGRSPDSVAPGSWWAGGAAARSPRARVMRAERAASGVAWAKRAQRPVDRARAGRWCWS